MNLEKSLIMIKTTVKISLLKDTWHHFSWASYSVYHGVSDNSCRCK